jgi:translation initiation factor IF-3
MNNRPRNHGPRVNDAITSREIRLIDAAGEMLGVTSPAEGIVKAKSVGLDLVEISPGAEPPVCKIMDYGKFKYEQQKKAHDARKKQKTVQIKEVKLRPNIDTHDFGIKMKAAHKFLDAGDKVKFTLRFRGREMAHQDLGMKLLDQIKQELAEKVKIESHPSFEGRQVVMVVAPVKL